MELSEPCSALRVKRMLPRVHRICREGSVFWDRWLWNIEKLSPWPRAPWSPKHVTLLTVSSGRVRVSHSGVPRHVWPTNISSEQHLRCPVKRRVAPPSGRKRSSWQISESLGRPSDSGPFHLCGHLCEVQFSMTIAYQRTTMASCVKTAREERPVI